MRFFDLIAYAAESSDHPAAAGGIGSLGVNLNALLFQVVNFAILLWLLNKFVYPFILKTLKERQAKIDSSLRAAEEIERSKNALKKEQEAILKVANDRATTLLAETERQAAAIVKQAEERANERAKQLVNDAESQLNQKIEDAKSELKRETLTLVALATEKLLQEKLDPVRDEAIIQQAIQKATAESGSHV